MTPKARLIELDGVRGIAIVAVLLFHWVERYPQLFGGNVPGTVSQHGHYGVTLFFVISGYVIFWSLENAGPVEFFVGRICRLYPAYWVAVVLTYTVVALAELPGRAVSMAAMLLNLTMVQQWLRVPHVDGVYWTLEVELAFYFWMAIAARWRIGLYLALAMLSGATAIAAAKSAGFDVPVILEISFLASYGECFLLGVILRMTKRESCNLLYKAGIILCILTALVARGVADSVALLLSLALVAAAVYQWYLLRWLLRNRVVVLVGVVSYPLYLLHQNIGYSIIWTLEARGIERFEAFLISGGAVMVLAWAVHILIEQRLSPWIRRKLYAKISLARRAEMPGEPSSRSDSSLLATKTGAGGGDE